MRSCFGGLLRRGDGRDGGCSSDGNGGSRHVLGRARRGLLSCHGGFGGLAEDDLDVVQRDRLGLPPFWVALVEGGGVVWS